MSSVSERKASLDLPREKRPWGMLWAMAVAQLVSWGTLYYAFAVLVVPMEQELGWSKTDLNGALSLGLLMAGLCAVPVGAWIDRHGGRAVMTVGSLCGAALLFYWSQVDTLGQFYGVYILIGAAMAMTLYEPSFAVATQTFGADYRRAITFITLVGGFAGTVFVPLSQICADLFGWRQTLMLLAACNLLVNASVHFFLIPSGRGPAKPLAGATAESEGVSAAAGGGHGSPLIAAMRRAPFWGLALCLVAYSITFTIVTFHFFPLLTERGVDTATIVACFTIVGPMQVVGRLILLAFGRRISARGAGLIAIAALTLSILMLQLGPPVFAWLALVTAIYGAANGTMTIVRGTVVPELIGPEGYGIINGALTFSAMVAKSVAPLGAALIWGVGGSYELVLWCVFAASCVSLAAFAFAVAAARGQRA